MWQLVQRPTKDGHLHQVRVAGTQDRFEDISEAELAKTVTDWIREGPTSPQVNVCCQKKRPSVPESTAGSPASRLCKFRSPRESPTGLFPAIQENTASWLPWLVSIPSGVCHTVPGHLLRSPPSLQPAAAKDFCSRPAPAHTPGSTTPDHVLSGAVCGPRTEAAPREAVGRNSTRGPSRATPTKAPIIHFQRRPERPLKAEAWPC